MTDRLELRIEAHDVDRIDVLLEDGRDRRIQYRCDVPAATEPTLLRIDHEAARLARNPAGDFDFMRLKAMSLFVYPSHARRNAGLTLAGVLAQSGYVDAQGLRTSSALHPSHRSEGNSVCRLARFASSSL